MLLFSAALLRLLPARSVLGPLCRFPLRGAVSLTTAAALLGFGVVAGANFLVILMTRNQVTKEVEEIEDCSVAIVLGCSPRVKTGRENLYFRYRMDAAAKLYLAGKVGKLLLSGDNRAQNYNEPEAMRRALRKRGVPADALVLDYAGFRTLDSVVRAKEVFGLSRFVIVSQPFHNHRAVYIARHLGVEVQGFNAQHVAGRSAIRTAAREALARVRMLLDLHLLGTQPHFLGPREPISP